WAILSDGGSSPSFTPTQKQCTLLPPGATSSAPASPTSQTPRPPRSIARPVSRWSSRASWPRRSPSRPWATRSDRPSGRRLARATLAAGDRPAHDHEVRVLRQLADLRRAPLALVEDSDISLVELAPEGLDGRVVAGLILGAPLREGGVACGVHADQSRHRIPP